MTGRSLIGDNLALKLISLILALVAWFAVQGERTYETPVEAPVEYLLPPDLILVADAPPPERVMLVATGTRAGLNKLRRASIRYFVDLETVGPGRVVHSFRAPPDGFPPEVSISTVSPAEIELVFDERMTDVFPVQLRTRGELPTGFVQTEVALSPNRVRLVGAKSDLLSLELVRTVPFALSGRKSDFEGEIGLDLSKLHVLPETARSVRLVYRVQEAITTRSFGAVPVLFDEALEGFVVDPPASAVELEGPVVVLDAVARRGLEVRLVGTFDEEGWGEDGTRQVPWSTDAPEGGAVVRVQVLHPRAAEVTVSSVDPKRFRVTRPPQESPEEPTPDDGPRPQED
jgi:YbbR domain-containing protein